MAFTLHNEEITQITMLHPQIHKGNSVSAGSFGNVAVKGNIAAYSSRPTMLKCIPEY